jgi:hypothetical protein
MRSLDREVPAGLPEVVGRSTVGTLAVLGVARWTMRRRDIA